MKAYLILTYIVALGAISTVTSLSCYKCSSSDEKNCELLQKNQTCKPNEDVCISLESSYGFRKKCATVGILECEYPCKALINMGAKTCNVKSCCKDSMCNDKSYNKKIVISASRSKDFKISVSRYVIAAVLMVSMVLLH